MNIALIVRSKIFATQPFSGHRILTSYRSIKVQPSRWPNLRRIGDSRFRHIYNNTWGQFNMVGDFAPVFFSSEIPLEPSSKVPKVSQPKECPIAFLTCRPYS